MFVVIVLVSIKILVGCESFGLLMGEYLAGFPLVCTDLHIIMPVNKIYSLFIVYL